MRLFVSVSLALFLLNPVDSVKAEQDIINFECLSGTIGPFKITINLGNGLAIDNNFGQAYQVFKYTSAAIWMYQRLPEEEKEVAIMMIGWSGPESLLGEEGKWIETVVQSNGSTATPRRGICSRVS